MLVPNPFSQMRHVVSMNHWEAFFVLCFFLSISSYSQSQNMNDTDGAQRYLALGDSYTIGESVPENERWPVLLSEALGSKGIPTSVPQIIATTGWTTDELMVGIAEAKPKGPFDMVSLLIGVNNQYRSYPIETYEREFRQLLEMAIGFAGDNPSRVFVLSIPDYGATPFGASKNPAKIAQELAIYNAINQRISQELKVKWFDITPISRKATSDLELVASDALHPSGKMYKAWVQKIMEELPQHFKENAH